MDGTSGTVGIITIVHQGRVCAQHCSTISPHHPFPRESCVYFKLCSSMADYDIFREQLAIKYPAYGHALWEPSSWKPDSLNKSVEVGDVGFIRDGRFHCLFNALRSAEEQSNVPEDHEKLVPRVSDHISRGSLSSNHYSSPGIIMEPEPEFHASR